MAVIPGVNGIVVPTVPLASGGSGTAAPGVAVPSTTIPSVIDGTPVRVVTLALASAAGLWALKLAGFRFNVGVSA